MWKNLNLLRSIPWLCAAFSPQDLAVIIEIKNSYYLTMGGMVLNWNELDSTKYCPLVRRVDVETLSAAIALSMSVISDLQITAK